MHFNNRSRVITVKHHWNVSKPHLLRDIFDFPRKHILPLATSMEQFHGSPTWTAHVCYVDMPGPATCRLTATRLGCWVRFFVVQEMAGWKRPTPNHQQSPMLFFLKLFAMEFTFPWHDLVDCRYTIDIYLPCFLWDFLGFSMGFLVPTGIFHIPSLAFLWDFWLPLLQPSSRYGSGSWVKSRPVKSASKATAGNKKWATNGWLIGILVMVY